MESHDAARGVAVGISVWDLFVGEARAVVAAARSCSSWSAGDGMLERASSSLVDSHRLEWIEWRNDTRQSRRQAVPMRPLRVVDLRSPWPEAAPGVVMA